MAKRKAIIWFRTDLRVHDNEALSEALNAAEEIVPVYVFDPRIFSDYGKNGMRRMGRHRAKFILESVANLKKNLQNLGSDLSIYIGKPEDVIYDLANSLKSSWVFCMRERTRDEVHVQDELEKNLWTIGQELRYSRGKMLYYTQDLPFPITHVPDHYTAFKKEVERMIPVRKPIPIPDSLPSFKADPVLKMPELEDFGWSWEEDSYCDRKGGETNALELLKDLATPENFKSYGNSHTWLSAYMSNGCLSPKKIYWTLQRYEKSPLSKIWKDLYRDLITRDYFRLVCKKHGEAVFNKGGIRGKGDDHLTDDRKTLLTWINSNTGDLYIDAYMDQLYSTGYLSSVGRQAVAFYLVHHLGVNWQLGAEYFESILVDYDPCSNWGNWNVIAGVGGEYKDYSRFNHVYQAKKEDPQGIHLKKWLEKDHNLELSTASVFH